MVNKKPIDILENTLRKKGKLLDILLFDNTTQKNIIWGTNSYQNFGLNYDIKKEILPDQITGKRGKLIQPRAVKSREEQKRRTQDKAEVFTPLKIVREINNSIDRLNFKKIDNENWQNFVKETKLEITCGEAPFIVSRYDPTSHTGKLIKLDKRVGFLDKKLKIVSKYCKTSQSWITWAKKAFRASYGYEWQGDNLLLARENLLYTLQDYYLAKFGKVPSLKIKESFAEIISWNIFQMDGLKYVIPMSCHDVKEKEPYTMFGEITVRKKTTCKGCRFNNSKEHNGKYVKIMDWDKNKIIRFVDILK